MPETSVFQSKVVSFIESVRIFAQTELGCGCPDNIFEQIRIMTGDASFSQTALSIVVGERLLIGFVGADEIRPIEEKIPRILLSGVTYRDTTGLRRFRLVVNGTVSSDERKLIEKELSTYDDHVHVHYFD